MSNSYRSRVITGIAVLAVILLMPFAVFAGGQKDAAPAGATELTFGSWRTDDVKQINALIDEFNKEYPDIRIKFDPTNPPDYNATLRLQLEQGTGPDIYYARSYATGAQLYKDGYMLNLDGEAWLAKAFDEGALSPWTTEDGDQFAMPLIAVSHGIYYNVDIFNELELSIPKTWAELISAAAKVKEAGYIPFSNGIADQWDIAEVVWMSIAPGFIGGREGRLAYENGERAFNDAAMVSVFQAMKDLAPYLPEGFEAIGYNDSMALFLLEEAAMHFDGSWTIPAFTSQNPDFNWSIFPPPPPAGKKGGVCFHADAGIAINPASENIEEAKVFLEWLTSPQASAFIGDNLPGMFPMVKDTPSLENSYANTFLQNNEGKMLDVRFTWPKLMTGKPSAYNLILDGTNSVLKGDISPKQAADDLADGLAEWYTP